jgi:radical S-adenosyl methionine domain-containing protein 2
MLCYDSISKPQSAAIPDCYGLISVCWNITERCNYSCEFCYRQRHCQELTLSQAKMIVDNLSYSGLHKLSFSGGEPLLWTGLWDLIEHTHDLGITTMLVTNGSLLQSSDLATIEDVLDWIGLPLDGSDEETSVHMTRKPGHLTHVLELLEAVQDRRIKPKISTVLSSRNAYDIVNIARVIKAYRVRRWKVRQFYPIRFAALQNRDKFELGANEFDEIRNAVLPLLSDVNCEVIFESIHETERGYFNVAPDGRCFVSHDDTDIFIGDLKSQPVTEIWQHPLIDKELYYRRCEWLLERQNPVDTL